MILFYTHFRCIRKATILLIEPQERRDVEKMLGCQSYVPRAPAGVYIYHSHFGPEGLRGTFSFLSHKQPATQSSLGMCSIPRKRVVGPPQAAEGEHRFWIHAPPPYSLHPKHRVQDSSAFRLTTPPYPKLLFTTRGKGRCRVPSPNWTPPFRRGGGRVPLVSRTASAHTPSQPRLQRRGARDVRVLGPRRAPGQPASTRCYGTLDAFLTHCHRHRRNLHTTHTRGGQ